MENNRGELRDYRELALWCCIEQKKCVCGAERKIRAGSPATGPPQLQVKSRQKRRGLFGPLTLLYLLLRSYPKYSANIRSIVSRFPRAIYQDVLHIGMKRGSTGSHQTLLQNFLGL